MIEYVATFLWDHTGELLYLGLIFGLIEWLWPAVADQPKWRPDSKLDLMYSFVGPLVAFPLYSRAADVVLDLAGSLGLTSTWFGLHEPALWFLEDVQEFIRDQNWLVQLAAAVFVGDLVGYWRHRVMHTKYLWPFHAIHHSPQQMDWLSNERFHPVNSFVTGLLAVTGLVLCGFSPEVISAQMVARRSYSMFIHVNVPISYGPLNYILISPLMHRWHHSNDPRVIDKNLAVFFSFLDLVFGTYCVPKGEFPTSLGIPPDEMAPRFLDQLVYPFRKLKQLLLGPARNPVAPGASLALRAPDGVAAAPPPSAGTRSLSP